MTTMDEGDRRLPLGVEVRPDDGAAVAVTKDRARRRAKQRLVLGLAVTVLVLLAAGTLAALSDQRGDLGLADGEERRATSAGIDAGRPSPAAAACDHQARPVPADAAHVRQYAVDLDGNGSDDQAVVYVTDGQVYLRVAFAGGGSDETQVIGALDNGAADVLGIAHLGGDGVRRLWLNIGAASGPLLGLVAVQDCRVHEVVDRHGEPLRLWSAGTVDLSMESWFSCPGAGQLVEFTWSAERPPEIVAYRDPRWEGELTRRTYQLDGHTAHLVRERQETIARVEAPRDAYDCEVWDLDGVTERR